MPTINFNQLENWKITKQTNKSIKLELWFNQTDENVLGMAQLLAVGDEHEIKVSLEPQQ
jgi:hypothetical protein